MNQTHNNTLRTQVVVNLAADVSVVDISQPDASARRPSPSSTRRVFSQIAKLYRAPKASRSHSRRLISDVEFPERCARSNKDPSTALGTTVSVATLAEPGSGPLDADHHHELAVANARSKKIRKAAGVAGFNGWMTGLFAVVSAPFAPFSMVGFLITIGLGIVAYNEFQGRKRLLRFDDSAPRLLGWNQVGFLMMIIVYCLWMIFTGLTGEGPFAAEIAAKPELRQALGSLDGLDYFYKLILLAVYGTVIVLTGIFQGWNAYYYFSRRKHVEAYVRETPDWVIDVQRAAGGN